MVRSALLGLTLAAWALAQDPFVPLKLDGNAPVLDQSSARQDWVKITNQSLVMSRKPLRVALEDAGMTCVVFARGVDKPRHAKPILTGKGDYAGLFKSVNAMGFTRIVVRNPDTRRQWAARLEGGKPILED